MTAQVNVRERSENRDLVSLCLSLEQLLNSRAEVIVLRVLQHQGREELDGIRVVRSETGFRVYPDGRPNDLVRLQNCVGNIAGQLRCRQSLSEKLQLCIERYLRKRTASARLHTRAGRAIAIPLFGCLQRGFWRIGDRQYFDARRMLIAGLLSEPESTVDRMLRSNACMNAQFYSRRLVHLADAEESERLVREFVWPDESEYKSVVAGDASSRILLTIHMGDFTGAFKRISSHAASDRTATTLKREEAEVGWTELFAGGGSRHFLARHGHDEPLQIVSRLRRGGHTVAILADLKDDFGQTTTVQFLGRGARFVRGPAQLAVSGNACIYPFVTFQSGHEQHIEFAGRITPELRPGENFPDAVNRITQQLVRLAERWIRRSPDQWKFLGSLPDYFVTEDLNERQSVQT